MYLQDLSAIKIYANEVEITASAVLTTKVTEWGKSLDIMKLTQMCQNTLCGITKTYEV
jgi:hypothetical protein